MHKIFDLREMDVEQLRTLAESLNVKGFKKMEKDDLVYAVLDEEAKQNALKAPEKKEKPRDLSEKMEPIVQKWINDKKYCREGLNIKDVALEMGTNQNYLSQYINNNLGMTFQIWLNTLRIEESKILLTSKEKMSIEEIGIKVGIPQNYNFSRWFKQLTEMTPFQYRRQFSK